MPSRVRIALVLVVAILSISLGSIFVRLAGEAPPITIAFFRVFWASLILFPFYWFGSSKRTSQTVGILWYLLAGTSLALHFAFWIASLFYTTVAVSVVLVTTSPVLVAGISYLIFRERLTLLGWSGIALTMVGSAALVWNDLVQWGSWKGALMALAGAAMLAIYLSSGRQIRISRTLWQYVVPTYALAAVVLLFLAVLWQEKLWGFSTETHVWLLLLGIIPQCLGHTSYNWSLRFLPATVVSCLVLAEPIGASLLAWWLLDERPGGFVVLGGALVISGIFLVTLKGIRRQAEQVAVVILTVGNKVYVQPRREKGLLEGLLEFPGGKINDRESPKGAAVRELAEETGLQTAPSRLQLVSVQKYDYGDRNLNLHFFLCGLGSMPDKGPGRWISITELSADQVPAANRDILKWLKNELGHQTVQESDQKKQTGANYD